MEGFEFLVIVGLLIANLFRGTGNKINPDVLEERFNGIDEKLDRLLETEEDENY
ncbi:MAG: hypothetical protein M3O09_17900 [Acidobacteriota bacterium]|nr:hypothetical protein [Acidobacteriota bacterium]